MGHCSDVFSSQPGDLLLNIKVKEHSIFKLNEKNILSEIPITFAQAALGDNVTIDTVSGKLNIEIPKGTQSGDKIVLKHKGAYEFNPPDLYDETNFRGDHIITFKVVLG